MQEMPAIVVTFVKLQIMSCRRNIFCVKKKVAYVVVGLSHSVRMVHNVADKCVDGMLLC